MTERMNLFPIDLLLLKWLKENQVDVGLLLLQLILGNEMD
jgi:hypothetical protein